jgi:hypothetical protein
MAQLAPVLKRKDLSSRLKVRLVQSLVFPAVTYGCEAWNLSYTESAKLRTFETKCYRRAMNISYTEHVSNQEVFGRAGCDAMLEKQVRQRKLLYFGHVVRHESLEKDIMLGMMPDRRAQGGQRKTWSDDIRKWLTADGEGVSIPQAVRLAQDRTNYRCLVHTTLNPAVIS